MAQYYDQQLVDLIQFGFPLILIGHAFLVKPEKNHTSAGRFSHHVDKYTEEEFSFQPLAGPFDDQPFALHISPLMTIDKVGLDSKCTIIDLNWSKGLSMMEYLGIPILRYQI